MQLSAPINKCSKWFFKINDEECSDPAPIDLISFYAIHNVTKPRLVLHRHNTIVGVCRATQKAGRSRGLLARNYAITINVTPQCRVHPGGDAFTGWMGTSTLMVEELCPPQPWTFSLVKSTQQTFTVRSTTKLLFFCTFLTCKNITVYRSRSSNTRNTCTPV